MQLPAFLVEHQDAIINELDRVTPREAVHPAEVHRSMRYTLLAPSKRVRAVVTLLSADLCGRSDLALPAAASIELVHAASLILDDLPAMDDAPLRRGRKANHVVFGEAVAILAALGLMNLGYGVVAAAYEAPLSRRITALLADAIGSDGLIGGQTEDLLAVNAPLSFETLERIHRRKTGALFTAAAAAGALTAGAASEQLSWLSTYAKNLGLAFQIVDDLLDVEGDPSVTGKATRADLKKTTFVSFSGVGGARQLARELCDAAASALTPFGARADRLRALAQFVAARAV